MRTSTLLVATALLVTITACGSEATTDEGQKVSPPPAAPQTSLTVTLKKSPKSAPTSWTLTCDPPGGTHPEAEKACAQLAKSGPEAFPPVPEGQMCTKIYGGPEQGTIQGNYQGKPVDASFSRQDGCEIDRWSKVKDVFGELPRVR